MDGVRKDTTRNLKSEPRRHCVELLVAKHRGQGLRLDRSDKPVKYVGHTDDKYITNVTFMV